jgi:hypothetical protein
MLKNKVGCYQPGHQEGVKNPQLPHSPAYAMVATEVVAPVVPPVAVVDVWFASYASRTESLRGRQTRGDLKIEDVKVHRSAINVIIHQLTGFRLDELPGLLNGNGSA